MVDEGAVALERLAVGRDGVGAVGARARREHGVRRGREHGQVAAERVAEADARDGGEPVEVADADVGAVEDVLLHDARRVVVAQVVREPLDELVRLGVPHGAHVLDILREERAVPRGGGLEVGQREGDIELHRDDAVAIHAGRVCLRVRVRGGEVAFVVAGPIDLLTGNGKSYPRGRKVPRLTETPCKILVRGAHEKTRSVLALSRRERDGQVRFSAYVRREAGHSRGRDDRA